jgi:hypothetical protein
MHPNLFRTVIRKGINLKLLWNKVLCWKRHSRIAKYSKLLFVALSLFKLIITIYLLTVVDLGISKKVISGLKTENVIIVVVIVVNLYLLFRPLLEYVMKGIIYLLVLVVTCVSLPLLMVICKDYIYDSPDPQTNPLWKFKLGES